jgi:hypothetical protein
MLEFYLWLWPRMQLRYCLKRGGYLLGLTLFLIGPLMYVNVDLIRKGYKPSQAGLSIEGNDEAAKFDAVYLPEDDD